MNRKELKRALWIVTAVTVFTGMAYANGGEKKAFHGVGAALKNRTQTVQASQVMMDSQHYSRSSSADAGTMALFGIGLIGVAGLIRWRLRT